jgi:glycosyltransferase involved in cell wall biosynthesis
MRILFVAYGSSIHTARWISQFSDQGWDLHLFPDDEYYLSSELSGVTVHYLFRLGAANIDPGIRQETSGWPFRRGRERLRGISRRMNGDPLAPVSRLARAIRRLRPDLVHSFDTAGGLLTYDAFLRLGGDFPPWIHNSWGSDLYYFGREEQNRERTHGMMRSCGYFMADCQRELELAPEYGFKGEILGVYSAGGGYPIESMQQYRQPGRSSQRRVVTLKGRHGVLGGRGLDGLRAIELCREQLAGYRIAVYLPQGEIGGAVEYVRRHTGLDLTIVPEHTSHAGMLALFGSARVAIALGMTDGTPHSMLEAMTMGAWPIQSNTADTRGWIVEGHNGHAVPPEDPEVVAARLREILADDDRVDQASEYNLGLLRSRKDIGIVKPQLLAIYQRIAGKSVEGGR